MLVVQRLEPFLREFTALSIGDNTTTPRAQCSFESSQPTLSENRTTPLELRRGRSPGIDASASSLLPLQRELVLCRLVQ